MKNIEKIVNELQKDKFFFEGQFRIQGGLSYFFNDDFDKNNVKMRCSTQPCFLLKPKGSNQLLVLIFGGGSSSYTKKPGDSFLSKDLLSFRVGPDDEKDSMFLSVLSEIKAAHFQDIVGPGKRGIGHIKAAMELRYEKGIGRLEEISFAQGRNAIIEFYATVLHSKNSFGNFWMSVEF